MSRVGEHSSYFPTMFALLLLGLGAGTAFIPLLAIAMAHVTPPADLSGIVTSRCTFRRDRGRPRSRLDRSRPLPDRDGDSLPNAYQLAFLVGAACVAVGTAWRS